LKTACHLTRLQTLFATAKQKSKCLYIFQVVDNQILFLVECEEGDRILEDKVFELLTQLYSEMNARFDKVDTRQINQKMNY